MRVGTAGRRSACRTRCTPPAPRRAKLAALPLPHVPRTTLSVCAHRRRDQRQRDPDDAWLEIDVRSSSADALAALRGATSSRPCAPRCARRTRDARPGTPPLAYAISTIGDRPCGETARATIRSCAPPTEATRAIGRAPELATASTDANVPISLGVPAIAIGAGGRGGGVHTASEWYDNTDGTLGVARALTVVVSAAELAVAV